MWSRININEITKTTPNNSLFRIFETNKLFMIQNYCMRFFYNLSISLSRLTPLKIGRFFSIIIFLYYAQSNALSGTLMGCNSSSSSLKTVTVSGKIQLNRNFIATGQDAYKKTIDAAIEMQIKHLVGFYRNTKTGGVNSSISSYRGPVTIKKTEDISYGSEIQAKDFLLPHRSILEGTHSDYITSFLKKKKTAATDPAVAIYYDIDLIIADCSESSQINPILPLDPFLSFWIDPTEIKDKVWDTDFIPACQSYELVDFGNISQNWYFWSPIEKKNRSNNETAICKYDLDKKTYTPVFTKKSDIARSANLEKSFFKIKDHIKLSAVFGTGSSSPKFEQDAIIKYKSFIQRTAEACKSEVLVSACMNLWKTILTPSANEKFLEPGAFYFLSYLQNIYTLVDIKEFDLLKNQNHDKEIYLTLKGQLRNSLRPIVIHVYYGPTSLDYGPRISKDYSSFMHRAFHESDAISYLGHSGLGANVSLKKYSQIWQDDKLPKIQRNSPLWLMLSNCEGFSYFGFDLDSIMNDNIAAIITLSSGVEADVRFPLSQINVLDQIFTKHDVSVTDLMGRHIKSRDFYIDLRLSNVSEK